MTVVGDVNFAIRFAKIYFGTQKSRIREEILNLHSSQVKSLDFRVFYLYILPLESFY